MAGRTLRQISEATGYPAEALASVLGEEVQNGRVVRLRDGGFLLRRTAFPPAVLAALAEFELDGDRSRPARSRRAVRLGGEARRVRELAEGWGQFEDRSRKDAERPTVRRRR